jgi:hypothetical protein
MVRSVIDQVPHERAVFIVVTPTFAVFLAQASDIGGLIVAIVVVPVR